MTVGELLEYVNERVGDALRFASWHDGAQFGLLYVRAGLDRAGVTERTGTLHEQLSFRWPSEEAPEFGDVSATVQVRERCVTALFPLPDGRGILVGVEPHAGGDLYDVVAEGMDQLAGSELALRGGGENGKEKRCPHCGSTNYEVKSTRPGRPRTISKAYRCRYCDEAFDTPVLAESRIAVLEDD